MNTSVSSNLMNAKNLKHHEKGLNERLGSPRLIMATKLAFSISAIVIPTLQTVYWKNRLDAELWNPGFHCLARNELHWQVYLCIFDMKLKVFYVHRAPVAILRKYCEVRVATKLSHVDIADVGAYSGMI